MAFATGALSRGRVIWTQCGLVGFQAFVRIAEGFSNLSTTWTIMRSATLLSRVGGCCSPTSAAVTRDSETAAPWARIGESGVAGTGQEHLRFW